MLSIKKKFLFIHVPKTGGNSLQNILRGYSEDKIITLGKHQDGLERFEVRNDSISISKHSTLSQYQKQLDTDTFNKLYKFTTIRNPWDRLISFYFSPHRKVTTWDKNGFIRLMNNIPVLRHYIGAGDFYSQAVVRLGLKTRQKPLMENIDFLIKFENLNEDFTALCQNIHIPISDLPHSNKSEREHYSIYYDDELIELVAKKYKEEIELGDYSFQKEC